MAAWTGSNSGHKPWNCWSFYHSGISSWATWSATVVVQATRQPAEWWGWKSFSITKVRAPQLRSSEMLAYLGALRTPCLHNSRLNLGFFRSLSLHVINVPLQYIMWRGIPMRVAQLSGCIPSQLSDGVTGVTPWTSQLKLQIGPITVTGIPCSSKCDHHFFCSAMDSQYCC